MQHLAVNETQPAKKLLHFGLTVANQREDGFDPVVFSRFARELLRNSSGNSPARRNTNPTTRLSSSATKEAQWGRMASEISILFSQYSGRATPVWRSSMLTIAGRSRFSIFLT
jgi:hypothetical protein